MIVQIFLLLSAVLLGAEALRLWRLERRAVEWVRLRGRVVEEQPSSPLQWRDFSLEPRLGTEFFLEYEVEGRLYRHRAHEMSVSFRGIPIWRRPPAPDPWVLYNPDNPAEHWRENTKGLWKLLLALTLASAGLSFAVKLLFPSAP